MAYVIAKYKQEVVLHLRDIYITDSLKIINENISDIYGGKVLAGRYYDVINKQHEPTKTADEIITDIKQKMERLNGLF